MKFWYLVQTGDQRWLIPGRIRLHKKTTQASRVCACPFFRTLSSSLVKFYVRFSHLAFWGILHPCLSITKFVCSFSFYQSIISLFDELTLIEFSGKSKYKTYYNFNYIYTGLAGFNKKYKEKQHQFTCNYC